MTAGLRTLARLLEAPRRDGDEFRRYVRGLEPCGAARAPRIGGEGGARLPLYWTAEVHERLCGCLGQYHQLALGKTELGHAFFAHPRLTFPDPADYKVGVGELPDSPPGAGGEPVAGCGGSPYSPAGRRPGATLDPPAASSASGVAHGGRPGRAGPATGSDVPIWSMSQSTQSTAPSSAASRSPTCGCTTACC